MSSNVVYSLVLSFVSEDSEVFAQNPEIIKTVKNPLAENDLAEGSKAASEPATFSGARPSRSAAARWGDDPSIFRQGFVVVPTRFLSNYASLKPEPLTAGEALFVLQLMTFKWDTALPFPSYKTIAKRMGITDKMARRYAQSLDRKGYLRRQYQERKTNRFDLTGLFEALARTPYQGGEEETAPRKKGARRNQLKRTGPRHGPTGGAAEGPSCTGLLFGIEFGIEPAIALPNGDQPLLPQRCGTLPNGAQERGPFLGCLQGDLPPF